MPEMMPEATILRNYLDWVLSLPGTMLPNDDTDISMKLKTS